MQYLIPESFKDSSIRAFDSKWGIPQEGEAEATEVKTRYLREVAVAAEMKFLPCSSSTGAPFSGMTVTIDFQVERESQFS